MLTVCTWSWGNKYPVSYARKVAAGFARHLKMPHRFIVLTDNPKAFLPTGLSVWEIPRQDRSLLDIKGCFARLRTFDPEWQRAYGILEGDIVAWVDLDVVVTGELDPLFARPEPFVIFQGANSVNPCPYNGSLMMLRAGKHPEVWSKFSLSAAQSVPFYSFPDDQGWLAHIAPGAAGWQAGSGSGVYAFNKPGWPGGISLPAGARMVCFPGSKDPSLLRTVGWVRENWRV